MHTWWDEEDPVGALLEERPCGSGQAWAARVTGMGAEVDTGLRGLDSGEVGGDNSHQW